MYGIFLYKVYNAFIANAALDGRQLKLDEARQRHVNRQMGRLATRASALTER